MYQIYLKNGSAVGASSLTFEPHLVTSVTDWAALAALCADLTPENLEVFEVYEDGERLTGFTNVELAGVQVIPAEGELTVHLYLAGQMEASVDPEYKIAYETVTGVYDA